MFPENSASKLTSPLSASEKLWKADLVPTAGTAPCPLRCPNHDAEAHSQMLPPPHRMHCCISRRGHHPTDVYVVPS